MGKGRVKDHENFAIHRPRYTELGADEPRGKILVFPAEELRRRAALERWAAREPREPENIHAHWGAAGILLFWIGFILLLLGAFWFYP